MRSCTAVTLIGAETSALLEAARTAAGLGLQVYVRPQLPSGRDRQLVEHLQEVASGVERIRQRHPGGVTLVLGTELSLTSRAIVPLGSEFLRLLVILRLGRPLRRRITRRVDAEPLSSALGRVPRECVLSIDLDCGSDAGVLVAIESRGDREPAFDVCGRSLLDEPEWCRDR